MVQAIRKAEIARQAAVSAAAVSKAADAGRLIVDGAGLIDPAHPTNAQWLALHAQGYDSRGRPMSTHANTGRWRTARPQDERKEPKPGFAAGKRNLHSAGSAAASDDDGIDLAQLAAELRLDELSSGAALDDELRRLQVSSGAVLDLDRLLGNVARSIADGFNREGGLLVQVLSGIDDRLIALERRSDGLARCGEAAVRMAEMRRVLALAYQAEDGRLLSEAVTGLRDDVAQLRRLLGDLVRALAERFEC
jgi:hypothetical protein